MKKLPILIALSHSTNYLPEEVVKKTRISKKTREQYFDVGSKEIFDLPDCHLVAARYSRLYCDLNRASDQVAENNMKNRSGVVLLRTMQGYQIYKTSPQKPDYSTRIVEHQRFFQEIRSIIKKEKIHFFIAGHTMFTNSPTSNSEKCRSDVMLSNSDYCTCTAYTLNLLKVEFKKVGYSVSVNKPFKGGFLLNYFCHRDRLQGVQIEFRRGLIVNEKTFEINEKMVSVHNKKMDKVVRKFFNKLQKNFK
ncbi:N-formylglutamate amidohydrolase [Candidatus Gracilibacteria bacterium]|nr:N-formylglutamate amidohydrolase [Candidatus Gracilibacteria bacterium]